MFQRYFDTFHYSFVLYEDGINQTALRAVFSFVVPAQLECHKAALSSSSPHHTRKICLTV